jgi:hypothetical protein
MVPYGRAGVGWLPLTQVCPSAGSSPSRASSPARSHRG